MVDSVGLFAHTEFCNLVGYPFLLFSFFFFYRNKRTSTLNCPCPLNYLMKGSCCPASGLLPGLIAFLELTGFHTVSSEKASRVWEWHLVSVKGQAALGSCLWQGLIADAEGRVLCSDLNTDNKRKRLQNVIRQENCPAFIQENGYRDHIFYRNKSEWPPSWAEM